MDFLHFILSFFIEFSALVGFLVFAFLFGFFPGVHALIFFSTLSLFLSLLRDKRLPIFSIYSTMAVLVFGWLSIYLHSEYLVVLEYTLYNFTFALAAVWGYFKNKPVMKRLFPTMFVMSQRGWHIMSIGWGTVFVISGVFNEIFWRFYDQTTWLWFRTFMLCFSTLFGMLMFFVSRRERLPGSTPWGLKKY